MFTLSSKELLQCLGEECRRIPQSKTVEIIGAIPSILKVFIEGRGLN